MRQRGVSEPAVLVAVAALLIVACGDDDATSSGGQGGQVPDPPFYAGIDVSWEPCSLYDGAEDGLAECATTAMPLSWGDLGGERFEVRAKRLRAQGESRRQLWLLHGGPGASGTIGFAARMEAWHATDPALDLYTLDHRGTGYSGRLGCPDEESPTSPSGTSITAAEMPTCIASLEQQWGDDLAAVSSSASATDLAAFIEATREEGKDVLVWGGSYGTYWAQRYLQVAPAQADGVAIEGMAPADATFISYDEDGNRAGEDFFDLCATDAVCSAKLGPDPWQRLGDVLDALDQGHCASLGMPRRYFSLLLAYALYYAPMNAVVPALVYRLERCDPEDRAALASVFDFYFGEGGVWDLAFYSILLQHHITFSEMWDHPDFDGVDLEQYFADLQATAYVAKNLGATKLALSQDWPRYFDPEHDDQWAATDTPMLMMQGALDPATTIYRAQAYGAQFTGAQQHYVVFDQAPHGVSSATPLDAGFTQHCGQQLLEAFIQDPRGELDLACVDQVLPIDFAGNEELSFALLGTGDFWDNMVQASATGEIEAKKLQAAATRTRLRRLLASAERPALPEL